MRCPGLAIRTLAAVVVATSISACGGSGTAPDPSLNAGSTTTGNAATQRKPNATAVVTLRLPLHVAKATSGSKSQSTRRTPAYVNPSSGNTLVVSVNGYTVYDPNNPSNAYFSIPNSTNADGSVTLTIPIVGGSYNAGSVVVTEYDSNNDILAGGSNESYTDENGDYHTGAFSVTPGASASFVVTMQMNATQIAFTTDPTGQSGATVLSTNVSSPTNECESSPTTLYLFPADPSSTYVLPGSAAGYTGGDGSNYYPGVPPINLNYQTPNGAKLQQSILGSGIYTLTGNGTVTASFYEYNNYLGTYVDVYLTVGPGIC